MRWDCELTEADQVPVRHLLRDNARTRARCGEEKEARERDLFAALLLPLSCHTPSCDQTLVPALHGQSVCFHGEIPRPSQVVAVW